MCLYVFNYTEHIFHLLIGLQQIQEFAVEYPEEILLLEFGYFAAPKTHQMSDHRKSELADILIEYLGPIAVPHGI